MSQIRNEYAPCVDCEVDELRRLLERGLEGALIDVREYPEFAAGRVPGARPIPLGEIERRAGEIDSGGTVYVICRTGRRAKEARSRLLALGFGDVRNVAGGFLAWEAAGGAVERDRHAPWSLERQVRFVAGMLVLAGVLLGVYVAPPFLWLAGFVGAGLMFAGATDTCAMGMLLARMPWNVQKPREKPREKPTAC